MVSCEGLNVGALIALFDSKGRILFQHRDGGAKFNPHKWGFFGGGIKSGEDALSAVKRECFEELGYSLKSPKLAYEGSYGGRFYGHIFVELYDGSPLKQFEGDGRKWISLSEVENHDFGYSDLSVIKSLFKKINTLLS